MKPLIASVLIALLGVASAASPQSALILDRPSVVIVFTPDADVPVAERNSEGFDDFVSDFNLYSSSVASQLRGRQDVAFISSSATKFVFIGAEHHPVTRKALSGYGFIVYVPGKSPIIFEGVATDLDVLYALEHLAPKIRVPVKCGPNPEVSPRIHPGTVI